MIFRAYKGIKRAIVYVYHTNPKMIRLYYLALFDLSVNYNNIKNISNRELSNYAETVSMIELRHQNIYSNSFVPSWTNRLMRISFSLEFFNRVCFLISSYSRKFPLGHCMKLQFISHIKSVKKIQSNNDEPSWKYVNDLIFDILESSGISSEDAEKFANDLSEFFQYMSKFQRLRFHSELSFRKGRTKYLSMIMQKLENSSRLELSVPDSCVSHSSAKIHPRFSEFIQFGEVIVPKTHKIIRQLNLFLSFVQLKNPVNNDNNSNSFADLFWAAGPLFLHPIPISSLDFKKAVKFYLPGNDLETRFHRTRLLALTKLPKSKLELFFKTSVVTSELAKGFIDYVMFKQFSTTGRLPWKVFIGDDESCTFITS